jgi:hypothetical protein
LTTLNELTHLSCVRCGAVIPDVAIDTPDGPMPNGVWRMTSGVLAVREGLLLYCPRCVVKGVMVCSFCGCTDEAACPGGCGWYTPGFCTRCALERLGGEA